MGIKFTLPFTLQMDNKAAEAFTNNTTLKTKLKHIDVRQEWVRTLRNKNIIKPIHVDTKDSLADLFTKILPKNDFIRMRNKMMYRRQ